MVGSKESPPAPQDSPRPAATFPGSFPGSFPPAWTPRGELCPGGGRRSSPQAGGRSVAVTVAMAVTVPSSADLRWSSPSKPRRTPLPPCPPSWGSRQGRFPFPCPKHQHSGSAPSRRGGGGFIPAPLDLYKAKAPAGPCLQHLSSRLPQDCFRSTEEPKLARDKGAAFPPAVPRGPDQLPLPGDGGCFGCHLLHSQVSSSAGT